MEKKVIQKNLIRDCLPTVFSLMLSGLYSVMDGLFVGRAAGDTGLAAVNLAWPLVAVITATGIGIGLSLIHIFVQKVPTYCIKSAENFVDGKGVSEKFRWNMRICIHPEFRLLCRESRLRRCV